MPFGELAILRKTAKLGIDVAAAERPIAAAGAAIVLKHLHLVAGLAQFQGGRHAGKARAKDEDRCILDVA